MNAFNLTLTLMYFITSRDSNYKSITLTLATIQIHKHNHIININTNITKQNKNDERLDIG